MQFGWVDFSREDRAKALDVITRFQEPGAVDELGIGSIRDGFANMFFPGTSTIQTRAKYFLIVPYLLKDVVEKRDSEREILNEIDKQEKQCAIRLLEADTANERGIIGSRVLKSSNYKKWVARPPSDIYWSGIRTYGICTRNDISITGYLRESLRFKQMKEGFRSGNRSHYDTEQDDSDTGDAHAVSFWHLPEYPKDWKNTLKISLTPTEATFLRERITESHPNSLMTFFLNHKEIDLTKYDSDEDKNVFNAFIHDKEITKYLGEKMKRYITLAAESSELIYVARVCYNNLLHKGKNSEAHNELDRIWSDITRLTAVDLSAVTEILPKNTIDPRALYFLRNIQEAFQNKDRSRAELLIKKREWDLKKTPVRAKLHESNKDKFDPDEWIGGRYLDYRFYYARQILQDIFDGENGNATAKP